MTSERGSNGFSKTSKSRRVLVTGASGFVGSHVCDRMVAEGWTVRCLVRSTSSRGWLEHLPVEYAVSDVSQDNKLEEDMVGCDAVVHGAGITNAVRTEDFFEVNTRGTQRLWRAAANAGAKRFVFISSLAAAGPSLTDEPQDESADPHPVNEYGKSKRAAEEFIMQASDAMQGVIVRPPAVYGPRDADGLTLIRAAKTRIFPLPLQGKRELVLVYATDLAQGIHLALERGRPDGIYYFTDGGVHTLPEVGEAIAQALGVQIKMIPIPRWLLRTAALGGEFAGRVLGRVLPINMQRVKNFELDGWTASDARARRELGYDSKYGLRSGMEETVRWYQSVGWI